MTDTDGPFDGSPWAEAEWARHAAVWAASAVYGSPASSTSAGDLPLSVSALTVGLGAGRAWVRGFGFERDAVVMQTVAPNTHASFSRRDRIVLRRDLAAHAITPVLLTGTPASSPTAPALSQSESGSWDLPMFSFLVPPSSGTSISGLQDERVHLSATGRLLVINKAALDAYTVNQTVPARARVQDVTTGYEWERVGSSWVTPLRTVTGSGNATFPNQSFSFFNLDFSSGAFTAPPVIKAITGLGRTYSTTVTVDDLDNDSATVVVRSPFNLNGTIPVYWEATGR